MSNPSLDLLPIPAGEQGRLHYIVQNFERIREFFSAKLRGDEKWLDATLINGFTSSKVAYRVNRSGLVFLYGEGTGGGNGFKEWRTLFVLPVGYRPKNTATFYSLIGYSFIRVLSTGEVQVWIENTTTGTTTFRLTDVRFLAEQ